MRREGQRHRAPGLSALVPKPRTGGRSNRREGKGDPMQLNVAVNGFGRIGRNYVRCLLERGLPDRGVRVVAVNDLWDPATLAHLLKYDTTFGRLRWDVDHDDANLRSTATSCRPSARRTRPTCRGPTSAWTWSSSRPARCAPATTPPGTSRPAPAGCCSPRRARTSTRRSWSA